MIPNPNALDSVTLPKRWIVFHKNLFGLGLSFTCFPFIGKFLVGMQLVPYQLIPNVWKYQLSLTLVCRHLKIKMAEFNDAYMLKQSPNNVKKVYMWAKQDRGINVVLPKNEKN